MLYHGVDKKRDWGIYNYREKFIIPENFENQIKYLKNNYTIISLDKAIEYIKNKKNFPPNPLVITFDDGYKNIYKFAYSIIKNYHTLVTVFLATDFIEKNTPLWVDRLEYSINKCQNSLLKSKKQKIKCDKERREKMKNLLEAEKESELRKIELKCGEILNDFFTEREVYAPLSWKEVIEMQNSGIEFGAHSQTHAILTKISPKQAREEVKNSKILLETKLGKISQVFSYPNGQKNDFNEEIKEILRNYGFCGGLTTIAGLNNLNSDPFSLKRLSMDGTNDFVIFIVTISGIKFFLQKIKDYAKGNRLF